MCEVIEFEGGMGPKVRLGCILTGIALGVVTFHWLSNKVKGIDPNSPGLGQNTIMTFSRYEDHRVSSHDPHLLKPAIQTAQERGHEVVFWLGASQLHAINFFSEGDDLAVGYANQLSDQSDSQRRYVQYSGGNANFHELLCAYLQLREAGKKPDTLVVALTYDDLRENVRPMILECIKKKYGILQSDLGIQGLANLAAEGVQDNFGEQDPMARNPTAGSLQEDLEAWAVGKLESAWPAYGRRGQVLTIIRILMRSTIARVFGGVFNRRTPEVPEGTKKRNQRALEVLVQLARKDGLQVCLYQQPHRPGLEPFLHNRAKYNAWHQAIEKWAGETSGVFYKDLETIVPVHLWGLTSEGRPDCFHFRDEGHRLLGSAIESWLQSLPKNHVIQ